MYNFKYAFLFSLLLILLFEVNGQQPTKRIPITPEGTFETPSDQENTTTSPISPPGSNIDTLQRENGTTFADTITIANGEVQTTIIYSARDSIDLDVARQTMYLYGDAKIKYGDINLEANNIEINYITNELSAIGSVDSLGKPVGNPIFTDASGTYYTEQIKYNFKTRKAIISGVVTKQEDAFIHGEKIKKNELNEVFISEAVYTTCDLPHPHFDITAKKLKMIPGDKIVSGPFQLRINEVPMPLGFAFGLFPAPRKKTSGIIMPSYGEERRRGFFLRNGGYYFAISDYVDLMLMGEIYTKGTKGLTIGSNYRKRYAYDGSFSFNYLSQRLSEAIEDSVTQSDFRLSWAHRPQSRNNRRFTANINAATSNYNQNVALDPMGNINSTINSNVSYSMPLGRIFNLSIATRHTQDVRRNIVDLYLPDISFNMNRIYPFQNIGSNNNAWYKKIFFQQNFNYRRIVSNRIRRTDQPDSIAPFNFSTFPELWRNAQTSQSEPQPLSFSFPLSTTFSAFKHFTISPTINYTEIWYFSRFRHAYDPNMELTPPNTQMVRRDTVSGFSRAFRTNTNVRVQTMLYGFYYPRIGNIKGIRHVMTPILDFTYTPDYSRELFGFYERRQIDEEGNTALFSKYRGVPAPGHAGNITFELKNVLEMKVRSPKDTAVADRKIPIFDEFSIRSSYNIYAEQFNLSNIFMQARTRLFKNKMNIALQSSLDPYLYVSDGERFRRVNELRMNTGQGIGQIQAANLSVGTDLNPRARTAPRQEVPTAPVPDIIPDILEASPDVYVDFEIPWSLRVNYNLVYNRDQFNEGQTTQVFTFSGNLSLTEKWKIDFTSGYDVDRKEFTQTRIGVVRDLHCWELNFNWTPFGYFTNFNLNIHVKAPQLKDLAYRRQRTFQDR